MVSKRSFIVDPNLKFGYCKPRWKQKDNFTM